MSTSKRPFLGGGAGKAQPPKMTTRKIQDLEERESNHHLSVEAGEVDFGIDVVVGPVDFVELERLVPRFRADQKARQLHARLGADAVARLARVDVIRRVDGAAVEF